MKGLYKIGSQWCRKCDGDFVEHGKKCRNCGYRNIVKARKTKLNINEINEAIPDRYVYYNNTCCISEKEYELMDVAYWLDYESENNFHEVNKRTAW